MASHGADLIEQVVELIHRTGKSLSPRDRDRLSQVLHTKPGLLHPSQRDELLQLAIALWVPDSQAQERIRRQLGAPPMPAPTTRRRRRTWNRAAWSGLLGATTLALALYWLWLRDPIPLKQQPTPASSAETEAAPPLPDTTWQRVLLEPRRHSTITAAQPAQDIQSWWGWRTAMGLAFVAMGWWSMWVLWLANRRPVIQHGGADTADVAPAEPPSEDQRRQWRQWRRKLRRPRESRYAPVSTETWADTSARLLGCRGDEAPTPHLDVPATIHATAQDAGFFAPRYQVRARPQSLVVWVHTGSREDHIWLGAYRRLLAGWAARGLHLDVWEFAERPNQFSRPGDPSRRVVGLSALAREAAGRPLLVLSAALPRTEVDTGQAASWRSWLPAWRRRAWLDPACIGTADSTEWPAPDPDLERFPLHDSGTQAAIRYLTGGPCLAPDDLVLDLPWSSEALQRSLRVWAAQCALVPDASWDQVEEFRRRARMGVDSNIPHWQARRLLLRFLREESQSLTRSGASAPPSSFDEGGQGPSLELPTRVVGSLCRWLTHEEPELAENLRKDLLAQERAFQCPHGSIEWAAHMARLHRGEYFVEGPSEAKLEELRRLAAQYPDYADIFLMSLASIEAEWVSVSKPGSPHAGSGERQRRRATVRLSPWPALAAVALALGCGASAIALTRWVAEAPAVRTVGSAVVAPLYGLVNSSKPFDWVKIPGGDGIEPFCLWRTEVTVAQYRACVDAGGCTAPKSYDASADYDKYCNWGQSEREDHPVNCVDWEQAASFSRWVEGRLPSEKEWEWAARSGNPAFEYPWGEGPEADCERAIVDPSNSMDREKWGCNEERTAPVCSKTLGNSQQGACDLIGNVWEWTSDDYESASKAVRGCSWFSDARICRASDRGPYSPDGRYFFLGFRPARSGACPLDP